ncbi:MAG: peptidylprolyl isomerase [Sulfuricellaceae bacterium]|jgi:peptidyl-prolyl cis-trans isomerase C
MKSLKARILLAGFAGMLSASTCFADVTVNGTAISESLVGVLAKERAAQGQPDSPELRRAIRDDLIAREVVSQEAKKRGLDKNAEVAAQMQLASQSVLVRAYLQDYVKNHPISDSAVKAEYERIKVAMGDKEYQARHILVNSEAEAKDIEAQLKKGAKFDKLASEKSQDPGSKARGGELGWIARGNVVPEFGNALAKLKKGEVSDPVQTQYGWHIIKLEDIRPLKSPDFNSVQEALRQRLEQQEIQGVIADLRKQAKIEGADK